jgi:hypothetical protein
MKRLPLLLFIVFTYSTVSAQDTTNIKYMRMADVLQSIPNSATQFSAMTFLPRENTQGTPYLFEQWASMVLDSMENKKVRQSMIYNANLDLQKQQIVIKVSESKGYVPDMKNVQTFHFKIADTIYQYVSQLIDGKEKFMQLLTAKDYSLLKETYIEFRRADYVNNGISERGNKFDQYIKKYNYYLRSNDQVKKVALKEKDFLKALPAEKSKDAASWLKNNAKSFDETTAIQLLTYLNGKGS